MTTASRGGGEYAGADMLDALIDREHECVLLSNLPTIADGTRVPVHPIELGPKLSRQTYGELLLHAPQHIHRLRRALEREAPYDVLLVHYKKEQLLTPWLPSRLRRTVAWAEWGPVPYPLRAGIQNRVFRRAASGAGVVMAVSEGTRRSLVAVGVPGARIAVVPNVMDPDAVRFDGAARSALRAQLGIPADAFTIGSVSRLHVKKRNDVLVDAAKLLGPEVHLVIAGDGETEDDLRALAAPLGARAHFLPTPHRQIAGVLSALDVSVFCPSPTEGAPRAVIYAMLASRPVVSSGPEGVTDMIEPGMGAIAAREHDPAALAEALRAYQDDPERVRRDGDRGRELAIQRYDGATIAAQVEQLLEAAVGRSGRSG